MLRCCRPVRATTLTFDPYDVAILLLAGTVETLGRTVTAPSVICYQAGEPHGITSVGDVPARYLVFEFHADHLGKMQQSASEHAAIA